MPQTLGHQPSGRQPFLNQKEATISSQQPGPRSPLPSLGLSLSFWALPWSPRAGAAPLCPGKAPSSKTRLCRAVAFPELRGGLRRTLLALTQKRNHPFPEAGEDIIVMFSVVYLFFLSPLPGLDRPVAFALEVPRSPGPPGPPTPLASSVRPVTCVSDASAWGVGWVGWG